MPQRLLITGAAGGMATLLRPRLARDGRVLRLLDLARIPSCSDGAEIVQGSITDPSALDAACAGVDAVLHLGGMSTEQEWPLILDVNINGTYQMLEAARRQGIKRVILASSNHAVGFLDTRSGEIPATAPPQPDTRYGVSKAAMEALGALYAERHGMDVIAIRIGSCFERPRDARMLATWLSPGDAARLVEACLTTPAPGFRLVWGVSRNTRRWVSLKEAEALGYAPLDDAERFAAELLAVQGEPDRASPLMHYVGGSWCRRELDTPDNGKPI